MKKTISEQARDRREDLRKGEEKPKLVPRPPMNAGSPSLMQRLTGAAKNAAKVVGTKVAAPMSGKMSQDAGSMKSREDQEAALKKEVGGRR